MLKKLPEDWDQRSARARDLWWFQNLYKGDMPQLTLRAGITGAVVGAGLSLVNLYIGLKTGFAVGMGVTSVVISFVVFGILSKTRIVNQITLLENNAVQSASTAAGYMTGVVTASLPAYMMVTGEVFPMWQAIAWAIGLAILGVLFAFPWKRRFVNDGTYPFPEGTAAAVVMDGLHSDNPADRIKTKILGSGGLFAAAWAFATTSRWAFLPETALNFLPQFLLKWSVNMTTDAALIGIGGIVGPRTGLSWLLGGVINFLVIVPTLIYYGILDGEGLGYRTIVSWTLWPGVAMITTAALYPFITNTAMIRSAFKRTGAKVGGEDVLKSIELPMPVFYIGIPIASLVVVLMGNAFFGINILMGFGAIVLIGVFSLIAVNSTAQTSYTPSSALAKLSQLYAAAFAPGMTGVNLATGSITSEVCSNSANLLMDIRAGWLLGAKPRQQAVAHVIGAIAGATACTVAFYRIFDGDISLFGGDKMPLPGAIIWKGLADVLNEGLSAVPVSARWGALAGIVVAIGLEWLNNYWKREFKAQFPISAIGLSLGFVVQFFVSATVGFGALVFWLGSYAGSKKEGGLLNRVFTSDEGGVTLASSLIAGAGLAGIVILLIG